MQPNLPVPTGQALLDAAVPDTSLTEQALIEAFRAAVQAKLAPSDVLPAGFADGQSGSGLAPGTSQGASGQPATPTNLGTVVKPENLQSSPSIAYLAATALHQEIQLLNRYVMDAAQRDGYRPALVRFQITADPYRSRDGRAYDTYINLGLFTDPVRNVFVRGDTGGIGPALVGLLDQDRAARASALEIKDLGVSNEQPVIVPLVVTDQIEAALASQSEDRLRQIALTLSAAFAGLGGGADVVSTIREVNNELAREFNSTLTLGRINDNVVRIRLGAMLGPGGENQTFSRTHNITLLVLVPEKHTSPVYFTSQTTYADAKNGRVAKPRPPKDVTLQASKILRNYGIDPAQLKQRDCCQDKCGACPDRKSADVVINSILAAVYDDDYARYVQLIEELKTDLPGDLFSASGLWLQLAGTRQSSAFSTGRFELEQPHPWVQPQTAVLVDDGKANATVTLGGCKDVFPGKLTAWLAYTKDGRSGEPLASQKASLSADGTVLTLTFPSPKALGIDVVTTKGLHLDLEGFTLRHHTFDLLARTTPTQPTSSTAKATLSAGQTWLPAPGPQIIAVSVGLNDAAKKAIAAAKGKPVYFLTASGAQVAPQAATSSTIGVNPDAKLRFPVNGEGVARLQFSAYSSREEVRIQVVDVKGKAVSEPLIWDVAPAVRPEAEPVPAE